MSQDHADATGDHAVRRASAGVHLHDVESHADVESSPSGVESSPSLRKRTESSSHPPLQCSLAVPQITVSIDDSNESVSVPEPEPEPEPVECFPVADKPLLSFQNTLAI